MQILPALKSGGVERGTIDIAKALKAKGFEAIVVSSGGAMTYQLNEVGIKHFTIPVDSKNPVTIFTNIKKLVNLINENRVDIVHVRSRAPMWSAYYACIKTNTKLVATVHGTYSLSGFPFKKAYNAVMLRADKIIAVSNFIKNYLIENYQEALPDEITVIQRGADLNYFNCQKVSKSRIVDLIQKWQLPDDKKIILLPARFTEWKGHDFLISALKKVESDFLCVMVGSDHGHKKYRRYLEERIVREELSGKVKIFDHCKDMPAVYMLSHLVISASTRPEAFGRVAIEAQASSRVVVATKIGGSLETIVDGKTGFLVNVDDVDAMARAIDEVLKMPKDEYEIIGERARKHIEENFSNQKMCDETIGVYKELLARTI